MSKKKQPLPIEEKTEEELAQIIDVINASVLPDYIKVFILLCIDNALWFPHILQKKNMSLKRLKTMLFGKGYKSDKATNKTDSSDLLNGKESDAGVPNTITPDANNLATLTTGIASINMSANGTKEIELAVNQVIVAAESEHKTIKSGHGRMSHTVYEEYMEIFLSIDDFKSGDNCPLDYCGGKLYVFEPKQPRVLVRIVGQPIAEVRKVIIERLRCNLCDYLIQAEIPTWVGTEKYDAAFKAWVVLQKYYVAVPFYRQENFQRLLNFPLPDATQWDLTEQVASPCYPIFNELVVESANGELTNHDDTRVVIQEIIKENEQNPDLKRTGMFTSGFISTNGDHKIALFFNGSNHSGENLTAMLAKRCPTKSPIIQMCDALSCNIAKNIETITCNCLSHGFRKFEELLDDIPIPCLTIMRLLSTAYNNDDQTTEMSKLERLNYHQEHSKPSMELLQRYMQALFDEKIIEPNSDIGAAVKYMQKHWHKLTRFLTVAGAPICNNIVERALKVAIRNRKAAMFYRTRYSAHIGGMLTSIIYTCVLNNVNPYKYLIDVQQNAAAILKNPRQWLPWNYKQNLIHLPNAQASANQQEFVPDPDVLAAELSAVQQHAMH
jgi:hypothetical protein